LPASLLSPRRRTTRATSIDALVSEQLTYFGIDEKTDAGATMGRLARRFYECAGDLDALGRITAEVLPALDRTDRIAYFNAIKFLSFQLAKLLDSLQHPSRASYQGLGYSLGTQSAKGPYPVFDNVTALFSANPVIARTATYIYACAEWIADAFEGKELLLEIYSRLLNPTSIALANHMVDLEAGPHAAEYLAWNFNSGMAAVDAAFSHVLGRDDILICSRHIYGGVFQLIHDWFGRPGNLAIAVETFDGFGTDDFLLAWERASEKYADRLAQGRKIYVYLESPVNPHGYVLDVPGICKAAHARGSRVLLDATVGTPFLIRPLQREDSEERPDFVIHSYTKDISGGGSVIAGVVIGRNEDMFAPKGAPGWDQTLFWNVYYVKGAFLNADAAFEVLQGAKTLESRMLAKCINTQILAEFLDAHPRCHVRCPGLKTDPNYELASSLLHLGLPAPLFSVDIEAPLEDFARFFDALAPTFGHMISLGQSNTIIACPGLTTHSELSQKAQEDAQIRPTTIRMALGDEDPRDLLAHLVHAARLTLGEDFASGFPSAPDAEALIRETYTGVHRRYIESGARPGY
jgi:O-acetylhomoserine (thiol)-lyase